MQSNLKEDMIKLLEEDKEFRYTVAGLIGYKEILDRITRLEERVVSLEERVVSLEERIVKIEDRLEEHDKKFNTIIEEIKEIKRIQAEQSAKLIEHDKKFNTIMEELKALRESDLMLRRDMNEGFKRLDLKLSALGARWGIMNEEAVRNALKGIVEKDLGYKIEELNIYDDEGYIYGYPSNIQFDIVISDSKVILVEVSSHIKRSDPFIAKKKADLYHKIKRKIVDKILFVTPFIDEDAKEACNKLGIEVYSVDQD